MKRMLTICLCVLLCAALFGCSAEKKETKTTTQAPTTQVNKVDVDLTTLSSTMVYSEVYNMMVTPENYEGKTVKMKGNFAVYTNQEQTQNYYTVVVQDATACCAQGLEFIWEGHDDPRDVLTEGQEVTVIGEFQTYMEGETQYCHLITDDVEYTPQT